MNTIQDLYYGRISPYEMSISTALEYQKLKALAAKNEDLLKETLSDEQVHRRIPTWHETND